MTVVNNFVISVLINVKQTLKLSFNDTFLRFISYYTTFTVLGQTGNIIKIKQTALTSQPQENEMFAKLYRKISFFEEKHYLSKV